MLTALAARHGHQATRQEIVALDRLLVFLDYHGEERETAVEIEVITCAAICPCVAWPAVALESFVVDVTYPDACSAIETGIAVTAFVMTVSTLQTFLQDTKI